MTNGLGRAGAVKSAEARDRAAPKRKLIVSQRVVWSGGLLCGTLVKTDPPDPEHIGTGGMPCLDVFS